MQANDLTVGPIGKHLSRMAVFLFVAMLVQTAYSLIDIYWVGRLGREAIAAVAIGSNLMMAVFALTQVLSIGTVSQVSQAAGRKDKVMVATLFNQSQLFGLALGLLFALGTWIFRRSYSEAQAGNATTAQLAIDFLRWFIPALFLQFPMMGLGAALRGIGDMRTVAIAQAGTIFMNIALAPILIFGWGTGVAFGVAGASLATLISMIVGVGAMLWHVHRKGVHFDHAPGAWKPQFAVWKKLLMIGLPSGLEFGVMAVYFGFILAIIRPFGPAAQAAFGIGMRVLQAGMLPAMAIGFACSAVSGQNYGAKLAARVRESFRLALTASLITSLMLMVPLHLFPEALIRPFSTDPAVIAYGVDFLHMISWNLIATAMIFPCFSAFNGFGNTIPSLIASVTRIGFVIVSASWLSRQSDFQIHSVWLLSVAATVVQALMNLWFVRRAFRKYLGPLETPASIVTAEPATR